MPSAQKRWNSRTVLMVATAIVVACMFIPYGYLAVYPFRLFNTFVHEAGHAVATVITGGYVESMVVNLDTSGYVLRRGGWTPLVASAGYLGSILAGAALLFAGRKRSWARPALIVLGVSTLLATVYFSGYGSSLLTFAGFGLGVTMLALGRVQARDNKANAHTNAIGAGLILASLVYAWFMGGLLTWAVGLLIGGGVLVVAVYANSLIQHLTVLFLGVQLSVDGLNSIQMLFNLTSMGHDHNDAVNMSEAVGLPPAFWAFSWGLMGVAVIAGAFWMFWRQDCAGKQ